MSLPNHKAHGEEPSRPCWRAWRSRNSLKRPTPQLLHALVPSEPIRLQPEHHAHAGLCRASWERRLPARFSSRRDAYAPRALAVHGRNRQLEACFIMSSSSLPGSALLPCRRASRDDRSPALLICLWQSQGNTSSTLVQLLPCPRGVSVEGIVSSQRSRQVAIIASAATAFFPCHLGSQRASLEFELPPLLHLQAWRRVFVPTLVKLLLGEGRQYHGRFLQKVV